MLTAASLTTRHCTLCGPTAKKSLVYPASFQDSDLNAAVFSARNTPKKINFQVMKCNDCGILYSDPALSSETLGELYQDTSVNYEALEEQIYDSYFPILNKALTRLARRDCFVEVGGGRGFMLKYPMSKGFKSILEVEPSKEAAAQCRFQDPRIRFVQDSFKSGIIEEETADLVCFFQMLDHVSDPKAFLSQILLSLRKGGTSVCVVHNTRALSARLLGKHSPIIGLWHPYLFNPKNLKALFEKVGFTNVEAFPIPNRYALWYWLHEVPIPEKIKRLIGWGLKKLNLNNLRLNLYAGNFAVIASRPADPNTR